MPLPPDLAALDRGAPLAVALAAGVGVGLAAPGRSWAVPTADPAAVVATLEAQVRPRWTWWGRETADALAAAPVRVAACWDVGAVTQLLVGGPRPGVAAAWAQARGLDAAAGPRSGQLDLLAVRTEGGDGGDPEQPVRPDGYLRPEWVDGGWRRSPDRLAAWAATALDCASAQRRDRPELAADGPVRLTAWSESAAELLCAELQVDGLPMDLDRAHQLVAAAVGARPRDAAEAARLRADRDAAVLSHARTDVDLRDPAQVRAMLAAIGVDVPDTRSWRLEPLRGTHPLVDALLQWRKAERIATTYGYGWLDEFVRGGRLRGVWAGSDGAAGRMTASAGLHNLPAELRPAVTAEPGHVLVRADLGQVEPRVLAVVSGDAALAAAGREDDLYAPVAARLGVARPVAKVAVLAAMYGQTSGTAGAALRGLTTAYPTAMRFLDAAYADGRAGRDVRTTGGRLVRMPPLPATLDGEGVRAFQGARGRYARNAVVQGAAAEFFKIWAVVVRARVADLGARIVLCLHDELLVHAPAEHGDAVADRLRSCLAESAARWQGGRSEVRFVADIAVVGRWSDVKG
ncbi:DNA polymerase-1 [Jatrophihabitans endophyticus]|uniref:DNA-directed DNA polymerase n=1 Tax=Jatrophihabitans endophyticus TaxID=1206085 RepID=A0A1M5CTH9_9ACTN|nr:DNA polymerase [Jatrophihabitans endophyticus]SHF57957.1 DNA polymerase-1 [Jatrophihabitans endophyticus]